MSELNVSILREKFTVKDLSGKSTNIIVGSNRMKIPLQGEEGIINETFIIRGKFMHEVARMGAKLIQEFQRHGPIMSRPSKFNWEVTYFDVQSFYERNYEPDDWLCIYHKGQIVFEHGKRHPFLDVIEKCDVKNPDEYDFSVAMAEDAFRTAGKDVAIEHLSTIALVTHAFQGKVRCGVIDRNMVRTRTFNFAAEKMEDDEKAKTPEPAICIHMASHFLEGLNMAFKIALFNTRLKKGQAEQGSEEHERQKEQMKIMRDHQRAIKSFNTTYTVRYRPEMPDFDLAIKEAEQQLMKQK